MGNIKAIETCLQDVVVPCHSHELSEAPCNAVHHAQAQQLGRQRRGSPGKCTTPTYILVGLIHCHSLPCNTEMAHITGKQWLGRGHVVFNAPLDGATLPHFVDRTFGLLLSMLKMQ